MRVWRCKGCGREVQLEQEDIAVSGVPICGGCETESCNEEMELLPAPDAREIWLCPSCGFAASQKDDVVRKHGGACPRCGAGRPIRGMFMAEAAVRRRATSSNPKTGKAPQP